MGQLSRPARPPLRPPTRPISTGLDPSWSTPAPNRSSGLARALTNPVGLFAPLCWDEPAIGACPAHFKPLSCPVWGSSKADRDNIHIAFAGVRFHVEGLR